MPLTDVEKESLSPEEIAAIEDDDDAASEPSEQTSDDPSKADSSAQEEEAEAKAAAEAAEIKAKSEADAAAAAKAQADAAAAAKAKADAEAASAQKPDTDTIIPPPVAVFKPVDQAKLEAAKTTYEDARKKFDEGEIDYEKFDEAKTAYNELKWKDDLAKEYSASSQESLWKWEQQRFYEENPTFKSNGTINRAYTATVNHLMGTEEGQRMTDRQLLVEAKKIVDADLGLVKPPDASDPEKARADAVTKAKAQAGDRTAIKPDLGDLPAAGDEADRDEFDWLDKLDGAKFQAAIDKLTPEQLERYSAR